MLEGGSLHVLALWLMLVYCAAPGAVNAETVRRGLQGGFTSALHVQLGAIFGRVLWAGLALGGNHALSGRGLLHICLTALGAAVMLRVSWMSFRTTGTISASSTRAPTAQRADFAAGLALSLVNPLALAFWSGLFSLLRLDRPADWDTRTAGLLLATLAGAALFWSVGAALTISWGRHVAGQRAVRVVELLVGAALGGFGVHMAWEAVSAATSMIGR